MSLLLRMNLDPYDDTEDREVITNFFEKRGFDILPNGKKDGIDLSGWKANKAYAIEIARTSIWPIGANSYSGSCIEIPVRKWMHFYNALYQPGRMRYDVGIYCYMSIDRTHSMFLNFRDLVQIDVMEGNNIITPIKHGKPCSICEVPLNLVKKTECLD